MSTDDASRAASPDAATPAADADPEQTVKIRTQDITKRFGRVVALDGVSLDIHENEIFAIVGDNGAGKSTLMNVLNGVHSPNQGTVYIDGEPVNFDSPSEARASGIETVYQDLALMNDLDIATNIFVGRFPTRGVGPLRIIDWDEVYTRARRIMHDRLGRNLDMKTEVEFLSGGERQLVAIGRTLAFDPDILILDEPTSALSVDAAGLVHETIRRLQEQGMTIVIVSHDIEDVLDLADRVAVLFQGQVAAVGDTADFDVHRVSNIMVGGGNVDGD